MRSLLLLAFVLLAVTAASPVLGTQLIDYVNNFIGTFGHGYGIGGLPVGAQVPFGLARLSPDTSLGFEVWLSWQHTGGYYYGDTHVRMFSHTHLVGAGVMDYGTLGLFPTTSVPTSVGLSYADRYPWAARFSHDEETAEPGYYAVTLSPHERKQKVEAELTATLDVGLHRYTWQHSSQERVVVIDSSYVLTWDGCADSDVQVAANGTHQEVYGSLLNVGNLSDGVFVPGAAAASGNVTAAYVQFDDSVGTVEAYVAISLISVAQARANRQADFAGFSSPSSLFDQAKAETQSLWEKELSLVTVADAGDSFTADNMTVLYTSLYHTFLAPTRFTEAGGVYLGFDGEVHSANQTGRPRNFYSDMSIWDTFRTQFPWLALMQRDVMSDVAQSLVVIYEQGGDLPRWPLANGYTDTMVGTHADIVLADCLAHGLDFDVETAYAGMYQGATESQANAGRSDIEDWLSLGYIPVDEEDNGCVLTLDYSYDDWAVGLVAAYLGLADDADTFNDRSYNYKSQWNSTEQFLCPRTSDGVSQCPKLLHWFGDDWTEGNAWQYRYYVPHDVPGLIGLFNTTDFFVSQLEELMEKSFNAKSTLLPNPWYWGGNEPGLYTAFEFLYAGRPDLTQKYARQVLATLFPNAANGLPGNDDYGTMSAWALYNYLGIYPRAGDGSYVVASPVLADVTLHRDGKDIHIVSHGVGEENFYVVNATLNGEVMASPFLSVADLVDGADLEFWMSSEHSDFWA